MAQKHEITRDEVEALYERAQIQVIEGDNEIIIVPADDVHAGYYRVYVINCQDQLMADALHGSIFEALASMNSFLVSEYAAGYVPV